MRAVSGFCVPIKKKTKKPIFNKAVRGGIKKKKKKVVLNSFLIAFVSMKYKHHVEYVILNV